MLKDNEDFLRGLKALFTISEISQILSLEELADENFSMKYFFKFGSGSMATKNPPEQAIYTIAENRHGEPALAKIGDIFDETNENILKIGLPRLSFMIFRSFEDGISDLSLPSLVVIYGLDSEDV